MRINEIDELKKYKIPGFEKIDLLNELTSNDIANKTDLSYKVSLVILQLVKFSIVYSYLDSEEIEELFKYNQGDYVNNILNVFRLSSDILDALYNNDIIHPIMDVKTIQDDLYDVEEDCSAYIMDIRNIVEGDDYPFTEYDRYRNEFYSNCQQKYNYIVKMTSLLNGTTYYFEIIRLLTDYMQYKFFYESGMDQYKALGKADVAKYFYNLSNRAEIDYMSNNPGIFDFDDLDDNDYLKYLIILFENRYAKQKSLVYECNLCSRNALEYIEKCKKM